MGNPKPVHIFELKIVLEKSTVMDGAERLHPYIIQN